jgi:hypothetical protein
MTSMDGYLRPFLRAGTAFRIEGNIEARYAEIKHHIETEANCMRVSVTGFGKAFMIDFEDVLVAADVLYQRTQSI